MSRPAPGGRPSQWYGSAATRERMAARSAALHDDAWTIVSHLMAGMGIYAGIGWALSQWLGHTPLLVAGGALLGLFLALFMIYRRLSVDSTSEVDEPMRRSETRDVG
jgi:F0F1-type ATP synthase assembly protein I